MAKSLTSRREAFCLSYIESGSATEAYRKSGYGPGMSDKTANEAASRLLKNSKIKARIEELRAPAAEKAQLTLDSHLLNLLELRDRAAKQGQFSAAISAEIARGKAAGIYIEKIEHSGGFQIERIERVIVDSKR